MAGLGSFLGLELIDQGSFGQVWPTLAQVGSGRQDGKVSGDGSIKVGKPRGFNLVSGD